MCAGPAMALSGRVRILVLIGILAVGCLLFAHLRYSPKKLDHSPRTAATMSQSSRLPAEGEDRPAEEVVRTSSQKMKVERGEEKGEDEQRRMSQSMEQRRQSVIPDFLDVISDKKSVFPKPAPPLYLSLDNNEFDPKVELREGLVKPNVYFFWCGKRWFEFKHYLGLVSIIRTLRPDKVLFVHEYDIQVDSNLYNIWVDDLKHDFEFFKLVKMANWWSKEVCAKDHRLRLRAISEAIGTIGGVYVSENAWLMDLPVERRAVDIDMALDENLEGYLTIRGGVVTKDRPLADILSDNNTNLNILYSSCSSAHHLYQGVKSHCMIVNEAQYQAMYPMDFCYLENDPFAKLVRKLFYGTEEIRKPEPSYDTLVPNIGHMIWIGGGKMDFVFYLSLLSLLYVVKVDVVYIHGDQPPTGPYWAKINSMSHVRQRVKLISRDVPTMVYQGQIEPYYRALMSDIIRVDLMIKYGGVYTDTDAIWVKPLTEEERAYDAVATYDWVDWSYPFPDTINFGVSYGKRNAPFYRLFRESMRILHNDLHGFTGVSMPYKILEKHPHLIKIDRRLGVICYYSRCHPLWVKDYHNQTNDHVVANSIRNWKEDVHAFHWTHPNPIELHNETILMQSTGMFAELGRYVLEKAGLLGQ